ncbi:MAG TPA: YciI family protein [Gaiellaceae bacterium]|nr:YciI family protein [Gaiellaceae bacterium]
MKYALLIYPPSTIEYERLSEEERGAMEAEYLALAQEPGVLTGARLELPDATTTVRVEDGKTLATDGPFADTKEVLGGLYLIEVDNLDVALDRAARIPAARMGGAVEVRPIVEQ